MCHFHQDPIGCKRAPTYDSLYRAMLETLSKYVAAVENGSMPRYGGPAYFMKSLEWLMSEATIYKGHLRP